jgi:UDP-N-acetylglucosamine:LPS N-acetylglucosamine transferase
LLIVRRGVLIISASMGAGHDGAANELAKRLAAQGIEVRVVDYLQMIPFKLGGFVRWTYLFQLQRLAWTYDFTYQALNRGIGVLLFGPVVRAMSLATRRPLRRELRRSRPDAIVSTYPLASLVLGRMRKKRWLRVPVATYLTDFAVHPLWVHPGVDLHLAVSPMSAESAAKRGGRTNIAAGPLVGDRFRESMPQRDDVRRILGIESHERAVLVVAGSWGVGDVQKTVASITKAGEQYHPIVVCGQDAKLRERLLARGEGGTVLGWTDDMPGLMAAADALVENAGGLSAMEAFAAGLPVISFQPIAGHGKDNARFMAGSGVSVYAHDDDELAEELVRATTPGPERDRMIAAGRALFAGDPTDDVIDLAAKTKADALLVPFQSPRGRRRLALAAMSLVGVYFAMTVGAHGVAAIGVGVATPPKNVEDAVYVGVRVDGRELRHHDVVDAIQDLGVTLVVDGQTAGHAGEHLAELADAGVDIANGGWGKGRTLRWNRAHDDCDKSWRVIAQSSGQKAREFVPGRALDAFDQIYCRTGQGKQRLVRPNVTFAPEDVPDPEERRIYLLDGRDRDPVAVAVALADLEARASSEGLSIRPLEDLR